jgi:hypothetical protein
MLLEQVVSRWKNRGKFGSAIGIVPAALVHQGSQITHPGALHNAEVPSSASIAGRNHWPPQREY